MGFLVSYIFKGRFFFVVLYHILYLTLVYGTREIAVQFNADVADGMPWKFIPTQREVPFLL